MTDQTVTLRINATAQGVVPTLQRVSGAQRDVGQSARAVQTDFRATGQASVGLSGDLNRLRSGALGVAAALGGFAAVRGVARDIVTTTNTVTGLGQAMTASLGARAAQETAFVRGEIDRLGLEVLSTSGAYSRLTAATQGTNLAGQATRDTFTSVAQAARVLNLSAEQTEGTLRALEQMISKGTVQSEELKGQLGERLPGAFRIAAEAMGVTQAELNKLLDTGQVTAEELLPKLSQRLDELYGAGARAAAELPAADFARLGNAITDLEAAIGNAGFMTTLAQGATGLTTALRDLVASGAIDTIATGIGALAVVSGVAVFSRLAQGSAAYMANLIQARAAQSAWAEMVATTDLRIAASSSARAATEAANSLQAARAAESRAAAQLADINRTMQVVQAARAQETAKLSLAAADQAAAQRTIAATSSMATLSAALRANEDATDRLSAARTRLTAISTELAALGRAQSGVLAQQTSAQIALATAQTASTTAGARQAGALAASTAAQGALAANTAANATRMGALATGMGLVATAGRGLFALMGGWVTVALGTAYGVYYLATQQTEAEKTSESLAAAIDKVRSSTGAMRDEAISAAAAEVQASEMRIAALEREIDVRARRAGQGIGQVGEAQDMFDAVSIESATTALAQLRPALQEARAEFELAKRGMTLESASAQIRNDVADMVASIDRFVPAGSVLRAFGIEIDLAGAKARAAFANQVGIDAFVADLTTQIGSMRERIADLQGGAEAVARLKLADLSIVNPEEAKRVEGLIAELAGLERQYKGMQVAPRELKKEVRDLTAAAREQEGALEQLARITRSLTADVATPAQRAWMDYEDALADITAATDAAVVASQALGEEGKPLVEIFRQQDAAVRAATVALDTNTASIERQKEAQRQANDVVGNLLASLEEEARLASMTTEQRRVEEIVLRAVADAKGRVNEETNESLALSPAMQESLRKQVAGLYEVIDAAHEARESTQASQRAWTDFGGDLVNAMSRGMRGVKDLFKDTLRDLAQQLAQSAVLRMMASAFGGSFPGLAAAAGAGGQQSMLGAMLGQGGNGGLLSLLGGGSTGGGLGATGLISGFGQFLGPLALLAGASTGNRGMGALGGAIGGFTFASSAAGAGLIGSGLAGAAGASGTILGAQLGSVVPVIGTIIGAVVGTLLAGAFEKNPLLRVRSSEFSGDRLSEGRAQSQLGNIFVRTEDLGRNAPESQEIADQIAQFDNLIASFLDEEQLAGVRERLSAVNDTFRDGSATMAEALDVRFAAILSEMSADVQEFVGAADTLEERVQRLADGLQIERIIDAGEITGSLTEVADFMAEYRQGTEDLGQTYARLMAGTQLYELALEMTGQAFDGTRMELIAFAADMVTAAGGLEQAAGLWNAYYETFYSESERLEIQIAQATERAAAMFTEAGLNLSDFTGDTGAAAFREMFESMLPTLSAEGVVEMLRLAEALGVLIDLSGQAGDAIGGVSTSLEELMAGVTERLAEFAPSLTFAERLQAIGTEMDALIATATELGASEAQLAQIRALSAAEMGAVLDEQAAAYRDYVGLVRGLNDELASAGGLSEYQREMQEIGRWTRQTTDALNAAARAAGMQAAAEQDLALAHEVASIRAAEAMARLQARGRDIVGQLFGSQLEQIDAQIAAMSGGISGWASDTAGGMSEVTQATDQAVQAQIAAQQRIRDWLDGVMASELSGLRPKDQLTEALALFERERAAAEGGDAEAAGRLPQLADQILRLGRDVYGSSRGFFDLRDSIIDRMREFADMVFEQPLPNPGGNSSTGGGGGGGGASGDLSALQAERERILSEQAAAERLALAQELTAVIRDMMSANERPLSEIEATLGFSMSDLVAELGVNLSDMTVATATQLAGIASAMGVELTDLAASVGISLGSLADAQSLLNDALESQIARLPAGQRDLLEPLLRNVEEAAALGDTAGVEAGIADMETAIALMAPELRDMLAPFFARIEPADPVTELGHLASLDATAGSSLAELQAHTFSLAGIESAVLALGGSLPLQPRGPLAPGGGTVTPPPGYAVGTSYVPSDGIAYLHQGEMVFPASVSDFFRREGIPILVPPPVNTSSAGVDPAPDALLRAVLTAMREQQSTLEKLVERVDRAESTLARVGDEHNRTLNRQIDSFRR